MEAWARWRTSRLSGYGRSFLERCLAGMPGVNCRTCGGRGKASGSLYRAKQQYVVCPTCSGSGRVKLTASINKINPAFIYSTASSHGSIIEGVDDAVNSLRNDRRRHYEVIYEHYCSRRPGTEEMRAERLRISYGRYRNYLSEAHIYIKSALDTVTKVA